MLDTENLQHLSDDLKIRLSEFEKTFNTAGWGFLKKWFENEAKDREARLMFCQNWDQYVTIRAEWVVFKEMQNAEEQTYAEFERLALEAAEQKALEEEIDSLDFE